jgi:hypothetical protein
MNNISRQMHYRAVGVAFAGIVFGVLSQASLNATPPRPQPEFARQAVAHSDRRTLSSQHVSLAFEVFARSEASN